MEITEIPATNASKVIMGRKLFAVPASKKISITVDGVEDADLTYTVSANAHAEVNIEFRGREISLT
jgi:hypothetical protein